jgi:hypothetical protein
MTRHRAMLTRRGRVQWWTERHPIAARAAIVAGSLVYFAGLFALTVTP